MLACLTTCSSCCFSYVPSVLISCQAVTASVSFLPDFPSSNNTVEYMPRSTLGFSITTKGQIGLVCFFMQFTNLPLLLLGIQDLVSIQSQKRSFQYSTYISLPTTYNTVFQTRNFLFCIAKEILLFLQNECVCPNRTKANSFQFCILPILEAVRK